MIANRKINTGVFRGLALRRKLIAGSPEQTRLFSERASRDAWGWHVICAVLAVVVSAALNNFHKQLPGRDQSGERKKQGKQMGV